MSYFAVKYRQGCKLQFFHRRKLYSKVLISNQKTSTDPNSLFVSFFPSLTIFYVLRLATIELDLAVCCLAQPAKQLTTAQLDRLLLRLKRLSSNLFKSFIKFLINLSCVSSKKSFYVYLRCINHMLQIVIQIAEEHEIDSWCKS